jgi:hypothetical protein
VVKLNKKQIVLNLITPPKTIKGPFWSREYKILNSLMEQFPSEDFWQKVNFNQDWDSMVIFQSEYGKSLLEKKYKEFHYTIPAIEEIKLSSKSGEDKVISKKPKTVRGLFL